MNAYLSISASIILLLSTAGCNQRESSVSYIVEDKYFSQQWAVHYDESFFTNNGIDQEAHIHVDSYMYTYTGQGVKVAVIDDGLDIYHEDLRGALGDTFDIATQTDDVSANTALDYHGTAVSGIIGARTNAIGIRGLAPNAEIIFLKYKSTMSDAETIELFNKAVEFGADVINCSWGSGAVSPAVEAKIQDIATNAKGGQGIPIVFACGNNAINMNGDESNIPEVISVGATDKSNERAYYSNFGTNLDILAPGGLTIGITTLDPTGSDGMAHIDENYLLFNESSPFIGTSASAPIVTGVIALMLEKDPTLSRESIENILKENTDKIGSGYDSNGHSDYYGYGKINVEKIMGAF